MNLAGYVGEGEYICLNCASDQERNELTGLPPVFRTSEYVGSYRPTCGRCEKVIPMSFVQVCDHCYGGPRKSDLAHKQCPMCLETVLVCISCGTVFEKR